MRNIDKINQLKCQMFKAFRLAIFRAASVSRLLSELVEAADGWGMCWLGGIKPGERVGTGADWRVIRTGFLEFIFVVVESRDKLSLLTFFDTGEMVGVTKSGTMESSGWRISFNFLSISSASNCSTLMSLKGVTSVSSPKDRLSYPPLKIPLALSNDRSM